MEASWSGKLRQTRENSKECPSHSRAMRKKLRASYLHRTARHLQVHHGTKLAAGTEKHIIIWNTETGKELLKIQQRAYRVAFTPNGLRLVSGDRKDIQISDATTREKSSNSLTHTPITYTHYPLLPMAPNSQLHHMTRQRGSLT
jgi:WD40 repeat protein